MIPDPITDQNWLTDQPLWAKHTWTYNTTFTLSSADVNSIESASGKKGREEREEGGGRGRGGGREGGRITDQNWLTDQPLWAKHTWTYNTTFTLSSADLSLIESSTGKREEGRKEGRREGGREEGGREGGRITDQNWLTDQPLWAKHTWTYNTTFTLSSADLSLIESSTGKREEGRKEGRKEGRREEGGRREGGREGGSPIRIGLPTSRFGPSIRGRTTLPSHSLPLTSHP